MFFFFTGITSRAKKRIFKYVRYIPYVKQKIEKELYKFDNDFKKSTIERSGGLDFILTLPEIGLSANEVLAKVDQYIDLGKFNWDNGSVSGAVYNTNKEVSDVITAVYGKTALTNPLHTDVFPGISKMEAEVVRATANLFNGDAESCGTVGF